MEPIYVIASFDIGFKNFAFCVERVHASVEEFHKERDILSMARTADVCAWEVHDISQKGTVKETREALVAFFERLKPLFIDVSHFVIEQQYMVRGIGNIKAVKMAEILGTWLCLTFPNAVVCDFSSRNKTVAFGTSFKTKKARKAWAVSEVGRIVVGGPWEHAFLAHKKKDDLADCFLQSQAYKAKLFSTKMEKKIRSK